MGRLVLSEFWVDGVCGRHLNRNIFLSRQLYRRVQPRVELVEEYRIYQQRKRMVRSLQTLHLGGGLFFFTNWPYPQATERRLQYALACYRQPPSCRAVLSLLFFR